MSCVGMCDASTRFSLSASRTGEKESIAWEESKSSDETSACAGVDVACAGVDVCDGMSSATCGIRLVSSDVSSVWERSGRVTCVAGVGGAWMGEKMTCDDAVMLGVMGLASAAGEGGLICPAAAMGGLAYPNAACVVMGGDAYSLTCAVTCFAAVHAGMLLCIGVSGVRCDGVSAASVGGMVNDLMGRGRVVVEGGEMDMAVGRDHCIHIQRCRRQQHQHTSTEEESHTNREEEASYQQHLLRRGHAV